MNLLFSIAVIFVVILLFLFSLDLVTKHGDKLAVPNVNGKGFADAKKLLEDKGFEVLLQDSIYNDTSAPLSVLRQFPEADAEVKVNRTIYLTINRAVPPVIDMPSLEKMTFRSAALALKQYQLKLEDTIYKSDFAKDYVLEQRYNGERIKPGTKVAMGSSILLVLGTGQGVEEFGVPDLYGKTLVEARAYLESYGLILGLVLPTELQTNEQAYVIRQAPERFTADGRVNRIRQGQTIDIWVQPDKPADRAIDSTQSQQPL
jgi:beta-lactam-binding protein with PASTA domain